MLKFVFLIIYTIVKCLNNVGPNSLTESVVVASCKALTALVKVGCGHKIQRVLISIVLFCIRIL